MLVQNIMDKVLVMIDNFTEDGVAVPTAENIDVEKKVILLTDMAQKELWKLNKVTKQLELTNKPPENKLGESLALIDFEGDTQYYPNEQGVDGVQGYSIQVDKDASDNATLTYQELIGVTWTTLVAVVPTSITSLTTYKGVLTVADTTNPVRLKIEGTEHFLHKNRALWKYLYKSASVPTYEPWVKYDLPSDFNGLDVIIKEFDVAQYSQTANYKIENYRDFYFNYEFNGSIRITYKPIPVTITALTDTVTIDEPLAQSIVYDVCAKLGFYENPDLVNWAEGRRLESEAAAQVNDIPSAETVLDYYS
jgi:hypothetical protein